MNHLSICFLFFICFSFNRLTKVVNKIIDKFEFLDHKTEHDLFAVNDHIKNLIGKLEKREAKSESRLDDIEEVVKREVEGSLEHRLTALEMQMKGNVERKMTNIESSLDRKVSNIQVQTAEARRSQSGWIIPFIVLCAIVLSGAVGLYLFYLKMKKMHIL